MSNIILLFLCMLIGMPLRRYRRVPTMRMPRLNGFIVNVSLPALTLLQIHGIKLQSTLAYGCGHAVAAVRHRVAVLLGPLEISALYAGHHRRTHPWWPVSAIRPLSVCR